MKPIRNPENRFVYSVDEEARVVERLEKGWVTRIEFKSNGTVEVSHRKKEAS